MTTLFKKDPSDLSRVINEVNPENEWVFGHEVYPTRKFDGTAAMILCGEIYRRYDAKKGKPAPEGAIPCQEPDEITGHHPHWIKCSRDKKEDRYFFEAFDKLIPKLEGTYELCGEKVQNNPEKITGHRLIKHGSEVLDIDDFSFEALKEYLTDPTNDIEGIVFYNPTSMKMCKLRKKDFGVKR